jgi:hypothetical protein
MSSNFVNLDDWEGRWLPTAKPCPKCEHRHVVMKRGKRDGLPEAHCSMCHHLVFTVNPEQMVHMVRALRRPINKPVEPTWNVWPSVPAFADFQSEDWRHVGWFLDAAEAERYNADPDGYCAAHLGMTVEQYREWHAMEGLALCAARTKRGEPCRNPIYSIGDGCTAAEWLKAHRKYVCRVHEVVHAGGGGAAA